MHTGSPFRFVTNPGKVRGVVNDLPGVGTPRPANAVSVESNKPSEESGHHPSSGPEVRDSHLVNGMGASVRSLTSDR